MAIQGQQGARKQHDHDVHEEEVQKSIDFLKRNSKMIMALMVLILGAFIVLAIYKNYQNTIAERAGLELHQAESAEQLQDIVDNYPTAAIAPMALLSLSASHYRDGKYDLAVEGFQKLLADYGENTLLAPGAELNTAFSLMARGDLEDALTGFSAFVEKHPGHFLNSYAQLSKAICLEELGRDTDAKIVYEDFIAANPGEAWGELARENLEALNRRLANRG